ncbi:MAG: UDP-3-O-[3-hydroxymyristoyl] glucosamine N-acyltransferase, partial [Candidatus Krumholzibacteriia bacterium]
MFPLRLSEIANLVGGELIGEADPKIEGLAGLNDAHEHELSFVKTNTDLAKGAKSLAAALLVGREVTGCDKPCVRVDDPYLVFAELLANQLTAIDRVFPPEIHPTAVIHDSANVAGAVAIGAHTVVGAGTVLGSGTRLGAQVNLGCDVVLGDDCVIYPQVVIREGCVLGDRVIVHANSVLGSDGFGYLPTERGMKKVPQVGIVEIADDVEIGAGVTIDRATTGKTCIGKGTKLDNQVQIAHNVKVGAHCALSAQVGIAGSCTLGDGVIAGGQVGVGDHITIGAGSQLGGQSGVISDLPAGSKVFGTPAKAIKASFRLEAMVQRLPKMRDSLTELAETVSRL